jgi:hypothetical protein
MPWYGVSIFLWPFPGRSVTALSAINVTSILSHGLHELALMHCDIFLSLLAVTLETLVRRTILGLRFNLHKRYVLRDMVLLSTLTQNSCFGNGRYANGYGGTTSFWCERSGVQCGKSAGRTLAVFKTQQYITTETPTLCYKDYANFVCMMSGFSCHSSLSTHICIQVSLVRKNSKIHITHTFLKVLNPARMLPPVQVVYLRSGGAKIFIRISLTANRCTSMSNRSPKPFVNVDPPERTMLPNRAFRKSRSVRWIESTTI